MKYYEMSLPYITFKGKYLPDLLREFADFVEDNEYDATEITNIEIEHDDTDNDPADGNEFGQFYLSVVLVPF